MDDLYDDFDDDFDDDDDYDDDDDDDDYDDDHGDYEVLSGTLYDSAMGEISGGHIDFNDDGSRHQTVYGGDNENGPGGRYSWDTDRYGNVSREHFTDDSARKNTPERHPFGR